MTDMIDLLKKKAKLTKKIEILENELDFVEQTIKDTCTHEHTEKKSSYVYGGYDYQGQGNGCFGLIVL